MKTLKTLFVLALCALIFSCGQNNKDIQTLVAQPDTTYQNKIDSVRSQKEAKQIRLMDSLLCKVQAELDTTVIGFLQTDISEETTNNVMLQHNRINALLWSMRLSGDLDDGCEYKCKQYLDTLKSTMGSSKHASLEMLFIIQMYEMSLMKGKDRYSYIEYTYFIPKN